MTSNAMHGEGDLPVGRYFRHLRSDVLSLVPDDARRVLSVGCGAGVTEHALVQRGCSVTGIEPDRAAAEIAQAHGIEVLCGTAEDVAQLLAGRCFDCVIYADVLEHIVDPLAVLASHRRCMAPGCCVIISVPNFRHMSVCYELFVRGHIHYKDAGILDRTHVRLTTRAMVEEWLRQSGIVPNRIVYRFWRCYERWLSIISWRLLDPWVARQVLVRGTASAEAVYHDE